MYEGVDKMAAPSKEGLDYFPFDVNLVSDRKLRRAKLKYGYLSTIVYIALLCILYKDKGYYIDYADDKKEDVLWDIIELLQGKYQPTANLLENMIETLVECGLFDKKQFESNILTSKRAQMIYYRCTTERKITAVNFSVWLLSEKEMKAISEKSMILQLYYQTKNGVNQTINNQQQTIYPQIKEKKKKEKEKKENEKKEDEKKETICAEVSAPLLFTKDSFEMKLSAYLRDMVLKQLPKLSVPKTDEQLQKWAVFIEQMKRIDKLTEDEIKQILEFAVSDPFWQMNIRSTKTLREKKDTLMAQMLCKKNQASKQTQSHKNRFVNYEQRQWDFEELERLEQQLLQQEVEEIRKKKDKKNSTVNG